MLHIKIAHEINEGLRQQGKARGMSVSELIRQALCMCYQLDMLGISERQQQALEAYRGGFISLGKLNESMGRSAIETRKWLNEHFISQNNAFTEDDVKNGQ